MWATLFHCKDDCVEIATFKIDHSELNFLNFRTWNLILLWMESPLSFRYLKPPLRNTGCILCAFPFKKPDKFLLKIRTLNLFLSSMVWKNDRNPDNHPKNLRLLLSYLWLCSNSASPIFHWVNAKTFCLELEHIIPMCGVFMCVLILPPFSKQ